MRYEPSHIARLLLKRFTAEESAEDREVLDQWLAASPQHAALLAEIENESAFAERITLQSPAQTAALSERMLQRIQSGIAEKPINDFSDDRYVLKRHLSKVVWLRYAAAIILLAGAGIFFFLHKTRNPLVTMHTSAQQTNDVAPGKEGAVLKLADGRSIVLDSLANGVVAYQNGTTVSLKNGQLVYNAENSAVVGYNTMMTPRGRQFQIVLPDGTRVWLNAASSITYPTAFAVGERRVSITGEAYLEVAPDKSKPFHINVNESAEVKVLGTRFNVNAYADEEMIRTTLIEGGIKVTVPTKTIELHPRQEARILKTGEMTLAKSVDVDQTIAWTKGVFNFENASLPIVMRQLSRWYNVEVVYPHGIPDIRFGGKMPKSIPLSEMLIALGEVGVKFEINEMKIIVLP